MRHEIGIEGQPAGYAWLVETFSLSTLPLPHESCIGAPARLDTTRPGAVLEVFPPSYWAGDDAFDHLVFALKYDDLNLDALRQSFSRLGAGGVLAFVAAQPNGKYARQLGYLYEFLTGENLDLPVVIGCPYPDLLDPPDTSSLQRPQKACAGISMTTCSARRGSVRSCAGSLPSTRSWNRLCVAPAAGHQGNRRAGAVPGIRSRPGNVFRAAAQRCQDQPGPGRAADSDEPH